MRGMGGEERRDPFLAQVEKPSHQEVESCSPVGEEGAPRDLATGCETQGWSLALAQPWA